MGMRGRGLGERLTYGFGRDQESSEGRDSNGRSNKLEMN